MSVLADGIDHNDIWRSVQTGKGGTLFVKQGSFQPALLTNAGITLLPEEKREKAGAVDDIIDDDRPQPGHLRRYRVRERARTGPAQWARLGRALLSKAARERAPAGSIRATVQ